MVFGRRTGRAVAKAAIVPLALAACFGCSVSHASGGNRQGTPTRTSTTLTANPRTADPNPRHLALGDCFTADRVALIGGVLPPGPVHIGPCAQPHFAEVFGRFTIAGDDYPATDSLGPTADVDCANLATRYDMDSWTLAPTADPVRSFLPTKAQWAAGDHDGICFWVPRGGPVTSRLRHDETTLTSDQYAYLDAVDRPESALAESPQAQGEDDLPSYQNWTAGVADSLTTEAQLLGNRHWPARAQGPVEALIHRIDLITPQWRAASQSASLSEIKISVRNLQGQTSTPQERSVRAVLGLPTSRVH